MEATANSTQEGAGVATKHPGGSQGRRQLQDGLSASYRPRLELQSGGAGEEVGSCGGQVLGGDAHRVPGLCTALPQQLTKHSREPCDVEGTQTME